MNFIKFNDNQRIVNLDSVSNIGYVEEESKYKVIFNMDYGVSLRDKHSFEQDKTISDYIYWTCTDSELFKEMKKYVSEKTKEWLSCPYEINSRVINPEKISSIVYDIDAPSKRFKIIFNLSHSVSMRSSSGTTSEYVFFKFETFEKFMTCKKHIEGILHLF